MKKSARPRGIRGVLFDMDGTLVDSEILTERCVAQLLDSHGVGHEDLDLAQFHGVTWASAEQILKRRYPMLEKEPLAALLQQHFDRCCREEEVLLIDGARDTVIRASSLFPTAIVTSSNRQSVEYVLDRTDLRRHFRLYVCAEDCVQSKPAPECYLLAAKRLDLDPDSCLAFEDSVAGLSAARSAGMWTVALVRDPENLPNFAGLSDITIESYDELAPDFFESLAD